MSRFVDRQNSRFVNLGECECPGTPHPEGDWMKVRPKITYGEYLELGEKARSSAREGEFYLFITKIVEWNWVDEDGKPVPIDFGTFDALDPLAAAKLLSKLDEKPAKAADPKPSGARSRRR